MGKPKDNISHQEGQNSPPEITSFLSQLFLYTSVLSINSKLISLLRRVDHMGWFSIESRQLRLPESDWYHGFSQPRLCALLMTENCREINCLKKMISMHLLQLKTKNWTETTTRTLCWLVNKESWILPSQEAPLPQACRTAIGLAFHPNLS